MVDVVQNEAYVTVATNDTYCLGALVLGQSLRNVGTNRKLVILITPNVTSVIRPELASVFDKIEEVDVLNSNDEANLSLLERPDLGVTFTKLHCWRLTDFSKCVFLDADTMVIKNCDELFEREELSAVPDVGWPDCFNSGVFVYTPSLQTYKALLQFAIEQGSFDGGDQGLLNMYFSDWSTKDIKRHLSFIYNMNANASYSYAPAYKKFARDVKIVHFLGAIKPWMHHYDQSTNRVEPRDDSVHDMEHLQSWWNIAVQYIQPKLNIDCAGFAGEFARMKLDSNRAAISSEERQTAWEHGRVDYLGEDSFANIQRKLEKAIEGPNK